MKFTKNNFFRSLKKAKHALSGFFVHLNFFSKNKKSADLNHLDLNRELVYSLSTKKLPNAEQLKHLGRFLTTKERKIVRICALILILNFVYLGFVFFNKHIVSTPLAGGSYIEGLVGAPKYINPLYSSNRDVDADISRLIFSSLFKYDEKGVLVGDLVESWQRSDDGREYTLVLKNNAVWHNGEKLNADDIIFTVQAIKNPKFRSPLHSAFSGLEVEKMNDYAVKFKLSQPYAPFLGLLTFGILPKNIWGAVIPESATLAELNLKPIGSGPYKFKSLVKNKNGEIKEYTLEVNEAYYGAKPFIKEVSFRFYSDAESIVKALNDNSVDGVSYLPFSARKDLLAKSSLSFHYLNQPQLEAIFFNQKNNEFLTNKNILQALNIAIDRSYLIKGIFNGQAQESRGPILENNSAFNADLKKTVYDYAQAEKIIADEGFIKVNVSDDDLKDPSKEIEGITVSDFQEKASDAGVDPVGIWLVKKATKKVPENKFLVISLTYPDSADNALIAGKIQEYWQAIGVKTSLNPLPSSQIASEIAIEKNFEALLFGENVGADPDVYAFWHSSQISEGLNIASYANTNADKLLEAARVSTDENDRLEKYRSFQQLVVEDQGAIFLFSPNYLYLQVKKLHGFSGTSIIEPSDRFASISNWYLRVRHSFVW
ncbi:MAG: ABC transporter substrate-binding protein [Candidatus Falkowbacteria bacterium]|nr:ABC transporter substrate-binding protein [Candidatus Falkowbacteria bacterium]